MLAEHGEEALSAVAEQHHFDLILMDIQVQSYLHLELTLTLFWVP